MAFKGIAILAGKRLSFLDHLAPLCHVMQIPLLCTDPLIAFSAEYFYPKLDVIQANECNFQSILSDYSVFYTVEPCKLHADAMKFGDYFFKGASRTVAGWHGNSDKYKEEYWVERYVDEDVLLVYGNHQRTFFKEKGLETRIRNIVSIGNLRYSYYLFFEDFFNKKVAQFFVKNEQKKTIFYAPTWCHTSLEKNNSTFFEHYSFVLDNVPENFQLLLKLHPYLHTLYPDEVCSIKMKYKNCENIIFIGEIPLIYPFLTQADFYLGDYSSVGYDFLTQNRPLFFLGNEENVLAKCGHKIRHPSLFFNAIYEEDSYEEKRKEIYTNAFDATPSFQDLKLQIERLI